MKMVTIKEMCENIINKLGKEYLYDIYDDYVVISKVTFNCEKVVYVKKDSFNRVKIGVSVDSANRNHQLSNPAGLFIDDIYDSKYCTNWGEIENNLHKIFKSKNIKGEWFDIDEKDAIEELNKQIFKHEEYKNKREVYRYTLKQLERLYKITNSGSATGLEFVIEYDLNCTKDDLKRKIFDLMKSDDDDCEYESYVQLYFNIFEDETRINYSNFYIAKYDSYVGFASFNDDSCSGNLMMFASFFTECIKF